MTDRMPIEVFPPGEFIREELEARGWTQEVLAEILDRPPRLVSELISGKRAVSPETAQGLGAAFGTGAQFWMNLESAYRLWKVSRPQSSESDVARRSRLYSYAPVRDMIRRHWLEPSDNVSVLEKRILRFFEVGSLDEEPKLSHAARKSASYSDVSNELRAWLFRAKQLARCVHAAPYSKRRLQSGLGQLKTLLHSAEETRHIPRILAESGVRLVVLEQLPRTKIDAAAFWIDAKSPVIAISFRFDRIDWFWHTLMHDVDHILQGDVTWGSDPFVDLEVEQGEDRPPSESRADRNAANFLVPQGELDQFIARVKPLYSAKSIIGFANRLNIHPGIVVGQLKYREEIPYSHSRKMQVKVRDIVLDSALTDGWGHTVAIDGD